MIKNKIYIYQIMLLFKELKLFELLFPQTSVPGCFSAILLKLKE